ncbi:MAG: tyrosine-type recombinase/integrase [Candidatus Acidiferrales bacterium]
MTWATVAEVLEIPKTRGKYGEGSIQRRGDRWQISYYDAEGVRRRETYSTEKKAEKALRTKLTLKETNKLDPHEVRIKIDTVAALYLADRKGSAPKSYDWLKSVWDTHLKGFFSGFVASRITTERLVQYRNERIEVGASPTSVNKELVVLHAMFQHALSYTPPKIARVPNFPKRLKEPAPRQGFVTDEQYDLLQTHAKEPWLKALLAMAYDFGFRRSELVGRVQRNQPPMQVRQIDLKNRTIRLFPGSTKNDEGRLVRMTDEVYDRIRLCVEGKKPDDAVFTWSDGSPVLDFRETWKHLTKASGVPGLLLHDFRRAAVRNLIRSGVSETVAMRISGHKTRNIFDRYNIVAESDLAEAAAKRDASRISHKLVTEQNKNS